MKNEKLDWFLHAVFYKKKEILNKTKCRMDIVLTRYTNFFTNFFENTFITVTSRKWRIVWSVEYLCNWVIEVIVEENNCFDFLNNSPSPNCFRAKKKKRLLNLSSNIPIDFYQNHLSKKKSNKSTWEFMLFTLII